ncbi:MAG: ornithine cyclodeaminase family protein, partial [Candidatus Binatia bacterium]
MTLLINNAEVAQLITMRECVEVLEEAYREHGQGRAAHRRRSNIAVPTGDGRTFTFADFEGTVIKSGYHAVRLRSDVVEWLDETGQRTTKWAGRPGLFCGLALLYNIQTGELEGILNDGYLQVMRVGATSGVAGKYLSREDSATLGIVGAGNQARSHAEAMCAIRPVRKIQVASLRRESRAAFARAMEPKLKVEITPVDSAEEAFAGSDIVCLCTDASKPYVRPEWIEPGMFVSSARPFGEVGKEALSAFDIGVAHEQGFSPEVTAERFAKDYARAPGAPRQKDESLLPKATLAELCSGKISGRTMPEQKTYFANNEGHGIQFSATGAFILKRARERGLGRELPAEWFLQD